MSRNLVTITNVGQIDFPVWHVFYIYIYTYNDVHTITVAINVEVTMTMKENTMDRRRRG